MGKSETTPKSSNLYGNGAYEAVCLFRGRIMSRPERGKLQEFAADMAIRFDFEDVDILYAFLMRMWFLMETGSQVVLINGKVQVPTDQPAFKPTREQLAALRDCLSQAVEIMHDLPSNETLAASLHMADKSGCMDQQFEALTALAETSERAANLEGRSGRRPNEDWVREFCLACQDFWEWNRRGGTSIDFRTEFPTPITRWVEAVYIGIRRQKGHRDDLSKLKSAAKGFPAYRG